MPADALNKKTVRLRVKALQHEGTEVQGQRFLRKLNYTCREPDLCDNGGPAYPTGFMASTTLLLRIDQCLVCYEVTFLGSKMSRKCLQGRIHDSKKEQILLELFSPSKTSIKLD